MEKLVKLTGIVAPLNMINVDTDMIIPKQYLRTIKRTGLGQFLFDEMRRTGDGLEKPDFVLNREPYRHAKILVAGANFGCGSSREHAPWALADFGIRVVIAPSFADIFFNNSLKNGMLPLVLPQADVDTLMADAEAGKELTVDLEALQVIRDDNSRMDFTLDPFRRDCLLNGLDDIGLTLQHEDDISAFEAKQRLGQPWLWSSTN